MKAALKKTGILGYPALSWFLFFICGPLILVLITSFLTRGTYGGIEMQWTLDNYRRAFSWVYLSIFFESLKLSLVTTTLCLLVGYPMAWAMATAPAKERSILVFLMSVPFLMNLIIRVYSIRLFVGYDGPLLEVLRFLNVEHDPFAFSQNQFLVLYGMVTSYLPFMVFPLFAALDKFDFSLLEANADLGGSSKSALLKVLVPNTRGAIANGCLLVFVPAMGEFVIPDLLGGAKNMLIGNLITEQFLKARDWPFGSALTVLLIGSLTVIAASITLWGKKSYGKT